MQFYSSRSDVVVVTAAGYVVDIECKVSIADWRADIKKDKWTRPKQLEFWEKTVNRFYYAVPEALASAWDRVPVWPGAGLLVVGSQLGSSGQPGPWDFCKVVRPAKLRHKNKEGERVRGLICRQAYFRYHQIRNGRRNARMMEWASEATRADWEREHPNEPSPWGPR